MHPMDLLVPPGRWLHAGRSRTTSSRHAPPAPLTPLIGRGPELAELLAPGELAGLLGASRQSLNQILRSWEREGIIGRRDGRMHLTEPSTLVCRYLHA